MSTTARDCLAILADQLDPPELDLSDEPDFLNGWEPDGDNGQVPPPHPWRAWLFLGGRGAGKTAAGANYVDRHARRNPGAQIGIIGPTLRSVRAVCVDGIAGLLRVNSAIRFNRSDFTLRWPNGARGELFGAFTQEDVERLRGPEHDLIWGEEVAVWRQLEAAWTTADPGLRLGTNPHWILTTTPKPVPRIRRLIADPETVSTHGTTFGNRYLSQARRDQIGRDYAGTVFERQELYGELVEAEDDVVVPFGWVSECQREVIRPADVRLLPVELGVDVGGGGDESVIRERRGPVAGRVWRDRQRDTMRVVGKVMVALEQTGATAVKVDVIGIGAGVCDRLEELRVEGRHSARIVRVNVGERSSTPERFVNLRAELWWDVGRKLTEDRAWDLTALEDREVDQLTATHYRHDSAGRVVIEPKAETKARIGRSPDDADALLLAFYSPATPRGWRIRR